MNKILILVLAVTLTACGRRTDYKELTNADIINETKMCEAAGLSAAIVASLVEQKVQCIPRNCSKDSK